TAALRASGPTLPGISQQQVDELATDLETKLSKLSLARAMNASPLMAAWYTLFGVLEWTFHPGEPATDPTRPPYEQLDLYLERLLPSLLDPAGQLRERYGWGTAALDAAKLLAVLEIVLTRVGLPALFVPATATTPPLLQALAVDLTPTADGAGLDVEVVLRGEGEVTRPVEGLRPGVTGTVGVGGTLPTGARGELRPSFALRIAPPAPDRPVELLLSVRLESRPGQPIVLLGQAGGSRLEIDAFSVAAGLALTADPATGHAHGAPLAEASLSGGRLIIDASSGDGFVSSVLAGGRLEAGFELGLAFAPDTGLRFTGSGGLEVQIPVHLALGPVEIHTVLLAARLGGGSVPVELSAGFTAALGPVTAAVERMGVVAEFSLPPGGGNLGPAQLDFAFKPPSGIGLLVDAGVVTGGGYLYADPDRGEYAGALELDFAGLVALKAIGLISTRLPDRPGGFSLLVLITTEFGGGGIQLGYGFTLLAVGGLIGLNRGMDLRALVEGVATGRVESVMFPKDPVANAPRVISDLRAYFPPEDGTFLIGPMAKIGWGTPTLVSVSLGVVIEIPGNIAILGVLRCVLPTEHLPLLVLQVAFIGAIEFDRSRVWFFARIFDSRILTMTLDGGMGLLVSWGDDPQLVLTVGGFHPAYKPPQLPFPVPERICVDILHQPGRLIRVSGYFAVTSNTVQFGARAELRLGFDDFGIEGHLSFDALFQFSPFAFVVRISAGVCLKAFGVGIFGIDLDFQLEGVAPWRAQGRGSISLLFFEISADFDITWGEEHHTTLPPVDALTLLAAELARTEGWETRLPAGGTVPLVTLRPLREQDRLVLHPLGSLFVRQRILPLGVRIDRIGAQRPADAVRFSVGPADGSELVRLSTTADKFAMAQFRDMDDAGRLSAAAYEDQDAGIELGTAQDALAAVRAVRRSARYEAHVFDSTTAPAPGAPVGSASAHRVARAAAGAAGAAGTVTRFKSVSGAVFDRLRAGSSTSRSPLSRHEERLRRPFDAEDTARVAGPRFVIAYVRNNAQAFAPSAGLDQGRDGHRSRTAAEEALASWVVADPRLTGRLHVLPESEAARALARPGSWSDAGSAPYAAHLDAADAVRLADGAVLIAGGADASGAVLASAAVCDPVTLDWTALPDLRTPRARHTVTRLADHRVLVTGGQDEHGRALSSAEIFDPVTRAWSDAGALGTARYDHRATLLGTGEVLVTGGTAAPGEGSAARTLSSAELLDPRTGTWRPARDMADARCRHEAVLLGEQGPVLVVGGALETGGEPAALAFCERYDPTTDTWTPAASLTTPRTGHQATRLPDGTVLVTGGRAPGADGPGAPGRFDPAEPTSVERYVPAADAWSAEAPLPGAGRSGHRAVPLRSGRVLLVGGTGGPGRTTGYRSTLLFDPATHTWTPTGGTATGRHGFAAVELDDGRVLAVGGTVRSGPATPDGRRTTTATAEVHTP
ncbi:DUF6603 domain-containing protein, partial [Streptomyces sp. WAC06614]|uniref:DUF6603 domain-containing protein n=1 Tax=Streptomyces sp. WAC06614 TaxID=2487416 RepID=UPI000F778ECF